MYRGSKLKYLIYNGLLLISFSFLLTYELFYISQLVRHIIYSV